ncbi:peptidoglycan-binding domain-containing protein [Streptomyces sp. CA-251387]|uniref:peptidoglycan-binding domain-containing protein n=1 Tax=Streptomyces sp. CA-251387 TaxID=3240064 RepID=UPI003D92D023
MSEALRDARTAEAAAAEDFDPLRIRPYVELEGGDGREGETMPLRAVPTTAPPAAPSATEPTAPTFPTPLSPPATTPNAEDLSLFEPGTAHHDEADHDEADHDEADYGGEDYGGEDSEDAPRRAGRHRRTVLLGVGGALVAVLAAAGLASGLFTYEAPSRETALPNDVRPSVPAPSTSEASEEPSPTGAPTRSAPAAAPASPTPSTSPSSSPSASSASPTPSRSAEPTAPPSSSSAEATAPQDDSAAALQPAPPTLRRGDRGPEVTELELRLTQLGLYTREARGTYNEGVEDAVSRYQWARGIQPEEYGVYDLATRERLESETTEP